MPRRRSRLTEIERRNLTVRDGTLQELATHPSWPELEAHVERKRTDFERRLLAHVLHPTAPVDQRQVDYVHGFIDGMQWLVTVPIAAEHRLERTLKERGMTGGAS